MTRQWTSYGLLTGATVIGATSVACTKPPGPSLEPVHQSPVAEAVPRGSKAPEPPPVAEGRLALDSTAMCVALPSGVYCRGPMTRDDPLARPLHVSPLGDVVGLEIESSEILCGRQRNGPAHCWLLEAEPPTSLTLASPPVATSLAIIGQSRICATGTAGDLWCGRFDETPRRLETPEAVTAVVSDTNSAEELCVRGRSGGAWCFDSDEAEWTPHDELAYAFSPTIGCLGLPPQKLSCAWRDEADAAAIERAGHDQGPHFSDALEIEGYLANGIVVLADGRVAQARDWSWRALFDEALSYPVGVVEIETALNTCVLTAADEVWCQGENPMNVLGRGAPVLASSPILASTQPVDEVRADDRMTCARAKGKPWACASEGFVADVDDEVHDEPWSVDLIFAPCELDGAAVICELFAEGPKVSVLTEATTVVGTIRYGCAAVAGGKTRCWTHARETHEFVVSRPIPRSVGFAASSGRACIVTVDGGLWCWGETWCAGPEHGSMSESWCRKGDALLRATRVRSAPKALAVAVGWEHTCVLDKERRVACSGSNRRGQLGLGRVDAGTHAFVEVPGLEDVTAIVAGSMHTCALRSDRSLWCWGDNEEGQAGGGRQTSVGRWARWPLGATEEGPGDPPSLATKPPPRRDERETDAEPKPTE